MVFLISSTMKRTLLLIAILGFTQLLKAQPSAGSKVPEISLPNSGGGTTKLSSLQGKVVILHFWASWCGPCRRTNKELRSLYEKYKDKGLEIFSVSLDASEGMWRRAIEKDNMSWIQVIDKTGTKGDDITSTWAIRFIPSTWVIDRNGVLAGPAEDADQAKKLIKKLL